MRKEQAEEIICLVCDELGIKQPRIRLHSRGMRSYYYPSKKLISLSIKDHPLGITGSLIHELAHHADHEINQYPGRNRHPHGNRFVECLKLIAEIWYGDHALYPWRHEYKSIAKRF